MSSSPRCPPARPRILWIFAALFLAASALGCGDEVTPELRALRFIGQSPTSTAVLLFEIDFYDGDGDLDQGILETFIGQRTSGLGALDLTPIFARSQLEPGAVEGTLQVVVELALPRDEPLPDDGSSFDLGFRAQDGAGRTSNLAQVNLVIQR